MNQKLGDDSRPGSTTSSFDTDDYNEEGYDSDLVTHGDVDDFSFFKRERDFEEIQLEPKKYKPNLQPDNLMPSGTWVTEKGYGYGSIHIENSGFKLNGYLDFSGFREDSNVISIFDMKNLQFYQKNPMNGNQNKLTFSISSGRTDSNETWCIYFSDDFSRLSGSVCIDGIRHNLFSSISEFESLQDIPLGESVMCKSSRKLVKIRKFISIDKNFNVLLQGRNKSLEKVSWRDVFHAKKWFNLKTPKDWKIMLPNIIDEQIVQLDEFDSFFYKKI